MNSSEARRADGADPRRIGVDPDEFEAFYRQHVELVERFVMRRVADVHLVADLTADVFLAAIDASRRYEASRGTPTGWLYGIAFRVVAAERRRSARELRAHSRIAGRRLLDTDDIARMEDRLDAEAVTRSLVTAMASLSDAERGVLELTAVDGLAVAEAAEALGIRPGTARVRLHRARAALRADLTTAPDTTAEEAHR